MARKPKASVESEGNERRSASIRSSAQQIWLAGLGAFAKAQDEGARMFDALVKEGKTVEGKTQKGPGLRFSAMSGQWGKAANNATSRASAAWDKIEQVFEARVAQALHRLGVPTHRDIQTLTARVEALTASMDKLAGAKPRVATRKTAPKRKPPA